MRRFTFIAIVTVVLSAQGGMLSATSYHWEGSGTNGKTGTMLLDPSTQWDYDPNWTESGYPSGYGNSAYFFFTNAGRANALVQISLDAIYVDGTSQEAQLWVAENNQMFFNDIYIGHSGVGNATIESGYFRAKHTFTIGTRASGQGTYNVLGGIINSFVDLSVGYEGSGTVICDGGRVNADETLIVGDQAGSIGTIELKSGQLTPADCLIGRAGQGSLMQTGGECAVRESLWIGVDSTGSGLLDISGGNLSCVDLFVGASAGPGTLALSGSDAYVQASDNVTFGPHATVTAVPGATIHMTGSHFSNQSTDEAALAGMDNLTLLFEGGPSTEDLFEIASVDMGQVEQGYALNFGLDVLSVGSDDNTGRLKLVDEFNNGNRNGSGGAAEALYVDQLIVTDGSLLDLNGYHLYCHGFDGEAQSVINGQLDVVPEPATMLLLGTGLLGMVAAYRRRGTRR